MAAVDLSDFVDVLRREVTPAGTTTAVSDDELAGYLADAFWEARLDGFLLGYEADEDGLVTATSASMDFPRQDVALCVLYAGVRILRNQILNTKTAFRAKSGANEFEQQNSATMLAEMLKQLRSTKDRLIEQIRDQTPVHAFDALSTRLFNGMSYYGSIQLTEF